MPTARRTPRVAITGGHGFLGWHTACRYRALTGDRPVLLGRADLADPVALAGRLAGVDAVVHLAGVNRADSEREVEQGNVAAAGQLSAALKRLSAPVRIVYGNSVHAGGDTGYGRGKAAGAGVLEATAAETGGTLTDVLLPNLFGEHGRPAYNSFVATFCHAVAAGRPPEVTADREVLLLHAQRAAGALLDSALCGARPGRMEPAGVPATVSGVLATLQGFHRLYAGRGEFPDLADPFAKDLFNSYRSYLFPERYPMPAPVHADARGTLFEAVRSHGGTGHTFVSTTRPGATRGNHYHLHKVERFAVVQGQATIALRRLLTREVVRFTVSGEEPVLLDMPTMWVHNLTNTGQSELMTLFWADQLLDPVNPDQYAEPVEPTQEAGA